ncbi:MAG: hypothetical protein RIQ81_1410 [Pseudomonadota bacterium]
MEDHGHGLHPRKEDSALPVLDSLLIGISKPAKLRRKHAVGQRTRRL